MTDQARSGAEILRSTRVVVSPETFALVGLSHSGFAALMQNPELSPRMSAPFMILKDACEVTMMLDQTDLGTMRHALREARVESGYRMVTFDTELDLAVVGFLAEVSGILATAAIPILALSSFSRDSLLIRQTDLANALKALGPHVAELC